MSEDLLDILEKQLAQRGYDKTNDVKLSSRATNTAINTEPLKKPVISLDTQTVITKLSEINTYWQEKEKRTLKKSYNSKRFVSNSDNLLSRFITYTGIDELRNMTEASTHKFRKQLLSNGLGKRSVATYISSIKLYIRETSEEPDVYMPDVNIALSSFDRDVPSSELQEQVIPLLLLTKDFKSRLRKLPISSITLAVLFALLYNYDLETGRINVCKKEIADIVRRNNETVRLKIRELESLGFISTVIRTKLGNTYILTEKFFTTLGIPCPMVSNNVLSKPTDNNHIKQKQTLFQKIRGFFNKYIR